LTIENHLKNIIISPRSKKSTNSHESCLLAILKSFNLKTFDVIENYVSTIKTKEINNKMIGNQTESYISSIYTISKHMDGCM
jgi:hypothetical protein